MSHRTKIRIIRSGGLVALLGAPWLMSYIACNVGGWTVFPAALTGFFLMLGGAVLTTHAEDFA